MNAVDAIREKVRFEAETGITLGEALRQIDEGTFPPWRHVVDASAVAFPARQPVPTGIDLVRRRWPWFKGWLFG